MRKSAKLFASFVFLGWLTLGVANSGIAETLKVEVRETAGIRRFGYPIAVKLPESLSAAEGHFVLRDGERPVPAQFRREKAENGAGPWWLDFNVSMMPGEVRTFVLVHASDVAAAAEPPGLELEETPDGFRIGNRQHISWHTGRDLRGLLRSVEAGGLHHLRSEGVRLGFQSPKGALYDMDAKEVRVRVIRSGPLAVAIRYEFAPLSGSLAGMKSVVDLTFPASKSWVQVDWRIDDPRHAVGTLQTAIAQDLHAPTEAKPTLVDFGASSLVYMTLAPRMTGKLQASGTATQSSGSPSRSWAVLRGANGRLEPFVKRPAGADSNNAEGWAHIMDRNRCLALAVDEFGDGCLDTIETTAEGDVTIARKFLTEDASTKSCRFWLHFVGFPPHVGAVTSPQSMLAPLSVRVSKP